MKVPDARLSFSESNATFVCLVEAMRLLLARTQTSAERVFAEYPMLIMPAK